MHTHQTDDEIMAEHERHVDTVVEAIYSLSVKFAPQGLAPISIFEGAVKGAAMVMALRHNETPQDIANALDQMADGFRSMPPDAFKRKKPTCN